MTDHYVSYEQALKLKELGFDCACEKAYYNHAWMDKPKLVFNIIAHEEAENYDGTDIYPAPRLDQAQAWLRDCKGLHVSPDPYLVCDYDTGGSVYYERYLWSFELKKIPSGDYMKVADGGEFESYEQALSAGIEAALKILEEKK